jgi:hypothetical protein
MGRDQEKSGPDEVVSGEEFAAAPPESRGRFSEFLLLGTGLIQFLTGAALIVVPSAFPQYAWIVQGLARRGVTGLPLYVGGVVLTGLWLSTRTNRARAEAARDGAVAAAASIEKLGDEVGHLGDGLQGLRIEFVYLKDALQTQLEKTQAPASTSSDSPNDAVFRLAASLDQLGARLEERFNANHRELGQSLQAVSKEVAALSKEVEAVKAIAAAPRPEPVREEEDDTESSTPVRGIARIESNGAPLQVGESASIGSKDDGWDPEGSGRHGRLGLLDMLDDLGRILPRRTSPSIERPRLQPGVSSDPFADVQDEGWKHAASIPGPIPSGASGSTGPAGRAGEELRMQGAGELLGSGTPRTAGSLEDTALGIKLEELRSLLADVRVREALTSIERNRR